MTLNALFIFSLIGGAILMLAVPSLFGIVAGAAIIVASFAVFLCGLSADVRELHRAVSEMRQAVGRLDASQARGGDDSPGERV